MTAQPIDIVVLFLYVAVLGGFSFYFYFKVQHFSEYYDGGRRWRPWLIGFSVAAANLGAANTVGAVGMAYREGYSAMWYVMLQALAFIPFAYIAIHKMYALNEITLAEYLENRYRAWLRPVAATTLALATFAILPAQIVGGASIIHTLTGWNETGAYLGVGAALIVFTALGGLPSVVYNDVVQWSLLVGGLAVGLPILLAHGGGLAGIAAALPATHRNIWTGASGGWSFFTILAWSITVLIARFGSQEWFQRTRAASSPTAARRGFIMGGLMAAPFGVITMLVGVAALTQFPHLANPEEAFARAMMSAVPTGLRALVMSAILAAVAASGEASVNAATALIVNDVCRRYVFRDRTDRFYLRLSQAACVVLGFAALTMALVSPAIVAYIRLGFLLRTPVAIAVFAGLYWRGANAAGAAAGIIAGTLAVIGWHILGDPKMLDPFWIGAPVTILSLYTASRLFAGTYAVQAAGGGR